MQLDSFHGSISSTFYVQIVHTNVISAAFSSYMYIVKAAKTTFIRKICTFNVDEIDYIQILDILTLCYKNFLIEEWQIMIILSHTILKFVNRGKILFLSDF